MAFIIKLKEITVPFLEEVAGDIPFEITVFHVNLIQLALLKLRLNPVVQNYRELYGEDFENSSSYRDQTIEALLLLWHYCSWHNIPALNWLIVSSKSGVPGGAAKQDFKNTFSTENGYSDWASLKATEVSFLLRRKLIDIRVD